MQTPKDLLGGPSTSLGVCIHETGGPLKLERFLTSVTLDGVPFWRVWHI